MCYCAAVVEAVNCTVVVVQPEPRCAEQVAQAYVYTR
jgi:hypothetical protein